MHAGKPDRVDAIADPRRSYIFSIYHQRRKRRLEAEAAPASKQAADERGTLTLRLTKQLKPAPLLTGRDLIAAGYRPGPMFGIVLSEIEDAQLEGRISTAEEALRMAAGKLDLPG